jgi:hypothetical protein
MGGSQTFNKALSNLQVKIKKPPDINYVSWLGTQDKLSSLHMKCVRTLGSVKSLVSECMADDIALGCKRNWPISRYSISNNRFNKIKDCWMLMYFFENTLKLV